MPEACMIIVDNSESSRNGDYLPSRYQAQCDAVSLIHSAKMQDNPENAVGLMSMGGDGPKVLTTLTPELGKLLDGLHRTKIFGEPHLSTSIQVAGLALKHRQERSQRQRIIVFTCSAITEDEKALVKLAKRMKKYSVSIDIVGFGDLDDETLKKLEAFHANVDAGNTSHLAIVPAGPNLLSDQLVGTPILGGEGAVGGATSGGAERGEGAGDAFDFGVDENADPELALALRMSLEEEKARIEREKKKEEEEGKGKEKPETIREEAGETQQAEGSGSGSGSGSGNAEKQEEKKDEDKMDTD